MWAIQTLALIILTPTWLGKELFDLQPLGSLVDYLIIIGTAVIFGLLLKSFWRFRVFDRYVRIELDETLDV